MRKNIFVALVAVCLAVPGMATVSSFFPTKSLSFEMLESPESDSYRIDPQLVQDILRAAAEQCEYEYTTLQGWYDDGTVWIEKNGTSYHVTDGGGIGIILIEDAY
jgi:SH3-like domain-containing protein